MKISLACALLLYSNDKTVGGHRIRSLAKVDAQNQEENHGRILSDFKVYDYNVLMQADRNGKPTGAQKIQTHKYDDNDQIDTAANDGNTENFNYIDVLDHTKPKSGQKLQTHKNDDDY